MKHSENKAAGAHQQAKGLLDELEEAGDLDEDEEA